MTLIDIYIVNNSLGSSYVLLFTIYPKFMFYVKKWQQWIYVEIKYNNIFITKINTLINKRSQSIALFKKKVGDSINQNATKVKEK